MKRNDGESKYLLLLTSFAQQDERGHRVFSNTTNIDHRPSTIGKQLKPLPLILFHFIPFRFVSFRFLID